MAEAEYIGVARRFNDEEKAAYEQYYAEHTGAVSQPQESAGYYDGYMGDNGGASLDTGGQFPSAGAAGEPSTVQDQEPQASQLWIAQPENMLDIWNRYDQDPNYVDEHYTRDQINTLYEYMGYQNQGKPVDQWGPLMDNDPFVTDVIQKDNWWEPVKEDQGATIKDQTYKPSDPALQGWNQERELGDWEQLDWIGKLGVAISNNESGINAPSYVKKTQAAQQALSSAMAGAVGLKVAGSIAGMAGAGGAAALLTNPYVLAGAAVATGGLVFYQAVTGKELPILNKFLEISDLPDTLMEHTIGFGAQTYDITKANIQRANADKNDSYGLLAAINDSLKEVINNAGSMWQAGEYTYDVYGSIGDFSVDILKEIFKGEEGTKPGEAWYFNRGINEKQIMPEGTYGIEGLQGIRAIFKELDAQGYDKELQPAIVNELVNKAGGTSAFLSDYTMQMLLDLDILAGPLQNEGAGVLAKVTGNELGVEAAKANRGSMLTQVPFVGSIYQAISKAKAPGGINDFFDNWKNLARSADVNTLSAMDRFIGGINADGTIKEFARVEKTGLADMMPESKVAGVGKIANDVLNTYMYDVKDVADLRYRLSSLAGEVNSEFTNSADVLTVRDGMRHAIAETNPEIYIKQYENSEGARSTLFKAAADLNMEVKDVLDLYAEKPAVFEQMVRNYAAQHNGMFAGIDVSSGVDPISTIVQGFSTVKDGKGAPQAWNINQLQYQITTSMIDSMANYYTEYYGVKPNSTINMMFDTMKSAQSLLLLGWSPSYFINNVINNTVTAAAEGVLGFMSGRQIKQWLDAFGVKPARMDVDEGAMFRGQEGSSSKGGLEAFTSAAANAKKQGTDTGLKGALAGLNGALRTANNKLGVFSSLSGKMETLQGNQLTTVAIQQYWRQRWKRGEGFHLLPDVLVQTIEAQTPGMTNVIYAAIEAGLNMDQIYKTLFRDVYVRPDVNVEMKKVCDNLFQGEAKIYEEMFEKSGIMNEIRERFANSKTKEERAVILKDIQKKLDDYVNNLRREDLIQRANNTAAIVEAEGLAPVAQMMSEMEMNHQEFWLRIRREEGDVMTKTQSMDSREARALKADVFARHRNEFADLYKQEISTAAGIMKGLGFQNTSHAKYIGYMTEKNQNWVNFFEQKNKELQRAYSRTEALDAAAGPGKKADRVQKQQVWDEYHINVSTLYQEHFAKELELTGKMDQAFIEGYEFATQKSGEQFRQNFKRIAEIRQQMYEMQQDAHKKTKDMTPEDKNKFYAEYNPKYNAMIREIGNLGDANAQLINDAAESGPGYENHEPVIMSAEQTVAATETMDTNNAIREKAMRERRGFLDRDGIREGWIDAGRTPAEADLMMAVYDAAADTWARANGAYPDEFYSQAVQLKGIARWLPGVSEDQGARIEDQGVLRQTTILSGIQKLIDNVKGKPKPPVDYSVLSMSVPEYAAKYYDVIVNHYGNKNFREWFGIGTDHQSKVVDQYGLPLVVHHGSNVSFDIFDPNKAGDGAGGRDTWAAGPTFFFTESLKAAESYANKEHPEYINQSQDYVLRKILEKDKKNLEAVLPRALEWRNGFSRTTESLARSLYQGYRQYKDNLRNQFGDYINTILEEYLLSDEQLDREVISILEDSKIPEKAEDVAKRLMALDYQYTTLAFLVYDPNQFVHPGVVQDLYLNIVNPAYLDMQGDYYSESKYLEAIKKAKADGHDGLIIQNTIDGAGEITNVYVCFDNHQIKSIENDGTFNKLDPNILHQQAVDRIKGTFEHTEIGNIIRMLEASDVSTMVHESGHLFRRTLSQPLLTEFTTWAGFKDVAEFQELEARWQQNDPTLTDAERQRYVDAEEKFARGFEQYLMDGSAPTPGLKAVFKAFRDYLLDIYQKVKATVTGNDYSGQGEFVFHGATGDEVLNINAEINGVKLRDIFDRMLTDDVQRMPGYAELVQNLRTQLGQDRHNMRMSDKALSRRAQAEVTKTILQHFGSMEAAETALQNYQLPMEIAGWRVDDATLYEAITAAKADPTMNPFAPAEWHEVKGTNTYAYSITEANTGKKYQLQYKVVELNDLVPSNVWFGDQLILNEDYPADAQARNRSADQSDVYAHAANLNPGLLIDEQRAIDSGAPIVGEGNLYVESGNGRVLSLMYAKDHFPEQWANYQEYLRNMAGDYGIDPAQLDSFENPVLIRERLGGDSVTFAEDANSNRNKVMTASENALTDANKVNMGTLAALDIVPGESMDTFTTEKNAMPSVEWLRSLPEMERARYSTMNRNGDLVLSSDGKTRFINALFATLYATPESMEIIKSFSETSDSNITALESALKQSLPEMARAEGLIQTGSRDAALSITRDVMAAAGLLEDARKAGVNIHDYLAQQTIPGMERWTPTQALLAGFFGDAKNNVKRMRDFFNAYGEEVYKAGDPNQLSLFTETRTREQMIDAALSAAMGEKKAAEGESPLQAGGQSPALNQSVMDSTERWSSEFAKVLDENLQRTFDDGYAVKLDQAESVYLRGEINVPFETKVQRLLRDFSNNKNLSPDQYLYAWEYIEWWVKGAEGEAPQGNPIWENDIQKMVMQDFTYEYADLVNELKRRYKKGAEVDPTAAPNSGEYIKRTYHFEHGFWNIAGNVYKDGKLVAYLPEELDRMKRTIEADGQQYHVLGVDLQNPEGLVYYDPVLEIVRTVNIGKPEGFEEPRNAFAFIRPVRQGATPQTMPVADAYGELQSKYLNPALAAFGEAYNNADLEAQTAKMSGLDLGTRAQIAQWLNRDVSEDMRKEKYRAIKYSDMKKDAAMLNYNQRYGFDPILTMLSPYQFWYTRSMWKWAKRMIDKPALGNAYQRMKEYEDKNRQEILPSRLAGKFRILLPFLPDWMGGSYYIDLMSQLYPFSQFGQSYSSMMNQATLNARTEEILSEMVKASDITEEEMLQAKNDRSGSVWETAYAQAELEIGKQNGMKTLTDQFISPPIFMSWYQSKQAGEDPGTLSSTRTGNAIKTLTSDIPMVSTLGSFVGDAMTIPERALRKLYGFDYDEFGQYGDQQIRLQIAEMCAEGKINEVDALNAMVEKSGTIWDMAADRQRKINEIRVPGFAGAEGVKQLVQGNTDFGSALGGMVLSLLGGGSVFPEGEKTLREMKASRDQAAIDSANGDINAWNRWYDENPEYVTRTAAYKNDPEELLKYVLYQHITNAYYAEPYERQVDIANQMGAEFRAAIINKDTRNYEAVPTEKLAEWNARLGGKNPHIGSIDVKGVERVMRMSDQAVDVVQQYNEIKETQFPGISTIQDIYYSLPADQQKDFLDAVPVLKNYWEWNRTYKEDHPEVKEWMDKRSERYNEDTYYNSYAALSDYTKQELDYAKATGKEISETARYEMERTYKKFANSSFMSFEDYIKGMQNYK